MKIFDRNGEISSAELQPESLIVVVGRPNEKGQVEAKIIRVEYSKKNLNNSNDVSTSSATSTNR